jgi:ethanolamine transporter EutH
MMNETQGQTTQPEASPDTEKASLNKRLEAIAWGCFLIMLGGFALVPQDIIAKGFWSIGVGTIMLGLNVARYYYKIHMSGFTTVLGIIALLSGVLELFNVVRLEGAILLIVLGAYLIVKPWLERRQIFGKAG